jgi:hypothetical protein
VKDSISRLLVFIVTCTATIVCVDLSHAALDPSVYSLFRESTSINSIGLRVREPLFDSDKGLFYNQLRLDYTNDIVFQEARFDTTLRGLVDFEALTFEDYLVRYWDKGVRTSWSTTVVKNFNRSVGSMDGDEGLLPDIQLPVNIPKPLAAVIGRGGGLKVRGSNRISFGGSTTYLDPEPPSEIRKTSHFPSLEMDQVLRVNVEGTVGEKIHVFVDHDSEREFQTKNQVRVQYQGDEDEIIQEIELGDTRLSLPGSRFISGTVPSQGLFGAKARGTLGNFDFTVVATKQENQLEKKSFQGQSSQDSLLIRDFNFHENYHFSLVGDLGNWTGLQDSVPKGGTIKIWVDDLNGTNNEGGSDGSGGAVKAWARIDPNNPAFMIEEEYFGNFDLLVEVKDYTIDPNRLIVDFNRAIREDEVIAVSYETDGGLLVGDLSQEPYELKLIKPSELDTTSFTWDYQLRNQYYMGSTDVIESSIDVEIYKGDDRNPIFDEEINGVRRTYLNLFGLDDNNDGRVELSHIDFERGLLIFPDLKPFYQPHEKDGSLIPIEEENRPMYYDDSPVNLGLENNIYTVKVSYRSRTTSFNLGVLNVMEGSERVTVNGRLLQRGSDYEMIYEIGQVIFFNPDLLADNAEVKIDYEFAPLFAQSQVTMVGLRGDYQLAERSKLSTTWLIQSETSIEQRPRLGDESRRMIVGEVDGNLALEPGVMTSMADALPLVETDAKSHFDITGEVAVSLPNPNTRGEVYLDDFEGSSLIDSYSMARRSWKFSSPPEGETLESDEGGDLIWYNPPQGSVQEQDLNPNVPPEEKNKPRTVLSLNFTPASGPFPQDSWRSLVQSISNSGLDFSEKKFLNIWLHGNGGEVWFDLGTVSEDALRFDVSGNVMSPDDSLNTEDLNRDGKLDFNEDIGLDAVEGVDGTGVVGDDGNDDFRFTEDDRLLGNYSLINGKEGNKFLDSEDLNNNNTLERDEKVFRYKVDLDNPDSRIKIISENPNTGWKLYQIPIQNDSLYTEYGSPDFRRIKHLRLLLTGFDSADTVFVGSIEVEGNSWLERGIRNRGGAPVDPLTEKFTISIKNTSDNTDYFSPPGVGPEQVSGLPTDLQVIKEQSINLIYENLRARHLGLAVQPLFSQQNYIDYRSLKLWVRKEDGGGDNPNFFIQVGTDSLNYYEYSFAPTAAWQELVIPFKELTDVKQEALEALSPGGNPSDIDMVIGNIRVRGLPTITNVRRLALGVENTGDDADDTVSGEIWVDELRLTDVIRDKGIAQRLSVNADFADVGGVVVDYIGQGDQFRQLNQKRRNLETRDINFTASLNVDKFTPAPMGLDIPVSYSRKHGLDLPHYKTGSDIVFDEKAEQKEEKSESLSETVRVGYSKTKASPNMFIRATVDKLTGSFTTTSSRNTNPITRNRQKIENLTLRYNTPFEGDYDFPIFPSSLFGFLKHLHLPSLITESNLAKGLMSSRFRYMPSNLKLMGKLDRSNTERINTTSGVRVPYRKLHSTGDLNLSYRPIRSLSGSFQLNTLRDLDQRKTEDVLGLFSVNVGTEIGRKQNFKYTFSPEITSWLSPSYSYNTNYTENHTPEVSNSLGDSLDLRNFSNNTSRDLTINVGIPKLFSAMAGGDGAGVQRVDRVGGQKGEDEVVEEKKDGLWTRSMNGASRIIKNATVRFGRNKLTDYDYVEIIPSFMYQLGFKGLDLPPRELRKSRDLSVDGGMNLPAGISLNSGYSERETTSDFRGSSRFSNSITWPKVGLDISNVRLPMKLKEYMTSLNFRSQYSKSKEVSGTGTSGVESQRRGTTWSPFLSTSCQMKNGLAVTYSINRGETETLNFTGSKNTNLRENSSHQLNLNYSLRSSRGFGLPIPGLSSKKLKLRSDLRFQLAFSRGTTREVVVRPDGGDTEIINNVTTSFAPSADYDFSRITTGLRFNYNVVNDKKSGQKRITIGANIWMEFLF